MDMSFHYYMHNVNFDALPMDQLHECDDDDDEEEDDPDKLIFSNF